MSRPNELNSMNIPKLRRIVRNYALAFAGWAVLPTFSNVAAEPARIGVLNETPIGPDERSHWSFRPLQSPSPPITAGNNWGHNSIDQFVIVLMRKKGLTPAAEAGRPEIIRRLSFDLTGLPPSAEELHLFCGDSPPGAYERLVDRLLGSQAYGEKWGQHWLDLARFAETDGYEHDKIRATAWQYRDWVIAALNEDLPYDRFVALQIAGDEILPDNKPALFATGFCVAGPDMPDVNSQEERRHILLNEMTATVGAAFLGLQFGCAQCHDHKYDPISIGDFYRLRAWFEPAVSLTKDRSVTFLQSAKIAPTSRVLLRGDWRSPGPEVQPAFPRIADPWLESVPADQVQAPAGRRAVLAKWLTRPDHPLTTRVIVNRLWQHHFGRGLSQTPSDFGILGNEPHQLELLDWLACELVRRQWSLKEMHRLIVTSASYRQASTDRAQQSLAATTRDPSTAPDGVAPVPATSSLSDPSNRYLARFERRRLSGEELRDAMFSASESLDTSRGGPGVMPPLPVELTQNLLRGQWTVSPRRSDHYRRSIYVFARRNLRYPVFDVFDRPDGNASCSDRNRSTTALQSLHLLNSETSLDAARRLAGLVLHQRSNEEPSEQIRFAFVRAIGREPRAHELSSLADFVDQEQQLLKQESRSTESLALPIPNDETINPIYGAAFTDLCLALFNLNEFLYVD